MTHRRPRSLLVALAGAALLTMALAGQALAHPPDTHLHCLTTPSGDVHPIAPGVTLHSNHETAFHNFHSVVHQGAFLDHPLTLAADLTVPYACPPS